MIPTEVALIATLIWPHWAELDDDDPEEKAALNDVLSGAWRVYNAGYRKPSDPQ
jgi:hypothetical protein